ncbi:MAG: acetylornithine deacetylase [Gammaproteobacteria bacterium]|nr:acetylornithine deacetylase [Pseudomonadales bacterium]MCP5347542.1 acetylornithine deacetylase [Pseudomonadales bacterium]
MATEIPDFISNLNQLVGHASVSSANPALDMSNRPVIDYLAECFEQLGFRCEILECPSDTENRKFNLIATRGSGNGGLVLSGHTDTVPLDEALWSVNPFQVTQKDGRLYGLGCTDMKGFFPVVMEAIRQLGQAEFREPLIILATADEETSMYGARSLVERGIPQGRYAVIGEPTGLVPVMAHKGVMMESIRLLGRSGHSSDPSLGNNALDAMHAVIGELITWRGQIRQRYANDLFKISYPTLNLGCIRGGDNPNRICGSCELEFDIRLTPGMDQDAIREELVTRIGRIVDPLDIQFELVPLFPGVPAFITESNSEILRLVEAMTGQQGISVAFGTEAPHLQQLGLDTIVFGPGNIDQAHQPDEYLSLDMIEPGIAHIRKLIEKICL